MSKEPIKITKKIVGYAVKKNTEQLTEEDITPEPVGMHEGIDRPKSLKGRTYKIKPPSHDHGLYLTINHIELEGEIHPYEVFINSIDMSSYQWVVALTRSLSAIWRKGGDYSFILKEYESIVQPDGGYFGRNFESSKGKYFPSVLSEIGYILRNHFEKIGSLEKVLSIAEEQAVNTQKEPEESTGLAPGQVETGVTCPECSEPNMQLRDGCYTCVNGCGFSKCG